MTSRTSSSRCPSAARRSAARGRTGRRRAAGRRRPTSTRSPGCSSTSRWRTSTGRSTTSSRRRWHETAVPGSRVKVRFAGQDVDGFVARARRRRSEHDGPADAAAPGGQRRAGALARRSPRSPAPVAARYAGTRSDVLRLAVPPRHATTEKQPTPAEPRRRPSTPPRAAAAWAALPRPARRSCAALADGGRPRAVWSALPGDRLADAARRTPPPRRCASGRGALLVRARPPDVARLDAALTAVLGDGPPRRAHRRPRAGARATARSWPSPAAPRRVVVGTRAAAFAPVHDLGLVAIWDDGDDLHAEPRAPYPHAREVLLLRAAARGRGRAARRLRPHRRGGVPRSRTGWAASSPRRPRGAARRGAAGRGHRRDRPRARARPARPQPPGCPRRSHDAIRDGARRTGPVLVQTPAAGLRRRAGLRRAAARRPAARSAPARWR